MRRPHIFILNQTQKTFTTVRFYDPVDWKAAKKIFGDLFFFNTSEDETQTGADALVIVTEWNEYRNPDFERIGDLLVRPVIFDGRNLFEPKRMKHLGFEYFAIGRNGREFSSVSAQ